MNKQTIEDIEKRAEYIYGRIQDDLLKLEKDSSWLSMPPLMSNEQTNREELDELTTRVNDTKSMYIRLKERFKHEKLKQRIELSEDWLHYVHNIDHRTSELAHPIMFTAPLDATDNEDEFNKVWQTIHDERNKARINAEEIERRFKKLLKD